MEEQELILETIKIFPDTDPVLYLRKVKPHPDSGKLEQLCVYYRIGETGFDHSHFDTLKEAIKMYEEFKQIIIIKSKK